MEFEEVLHYLSARLADEAQRSLSEAEVAILSGAWKQQNYEHIAEASGYSVNYLQRSLGPNLWKMLSQITGRALNKTNAPTLLTQWVQEQTSKNLPSLQISLPPPLQSSDQVPRSPRCDWGEAMDVSTFYGRTEELSTLANWLLQDRCRLVAILGMGGIGKSALAAKISDQLQDAFEYVIWRSLRNAPTLESLLSEVVPFLSNQQETQPKRERLLHWLRAHRCLIILDNAETILQAGDRAGYYQPDYEDYGDFFRLVGESAHQSCMMITSREKPAEIAVMESIDGWVRSLPLSGSKEAALALVNSKGLQGSNTEKRLLCEHYSYSPLALKIVASSISSLFGGEISAFLKEETFVFNGLRRLLDQHFDRLSYLEQTCMYWLAINREWVTIDELSVDIGRTVSRASLLESLESLCWRCLIEKKFSRYTQQPVVMEYITHRFIDQITTELVTTKLRFFKQFAIVKNAVQDYIRESQIRVIVLPILYKFSIAFNRKDLLEQHFQHLLALLRSEPSSDCYGAGNLINLLCQQGIDLSGYNFSSLTFRHAHLQKLNLHHVNFAHAQFINPVFTHTVTSIFAVALSPDGKRLATGESTGEIHLWQVDDAQPLLVLDGHANRVLAICFSPDGRWLASASADSKINLWDVESGKLLAVLEGHTNGVCSISFSADQTILASASMDCTIRLWNLQTRQQIYTLNAHTDWAWAVCFSPLFNSKQLASGGADAVIHLWDANTGKLLKTLTEHSDRIWSVQFSPDARLLASASEDLTVRLWDVETGRLLHTLEGHSSIVWSVSFSTNGKMVASGGSDQTVRIWDVETGRLLKTLLGHTNRVWSVRFSPVAVDLPSGSTQLLASGSADCTAKLWDAESGRLIKSIQGYTNGVRAIDFSSDGAILASGTAADHAIKLWDVETGQLLNTLQHHTDSIHAVKCYLNSVGEDMLVSGGSDQSVNVIHIKSGRLIKTLRSHTDTIWSVSVNHQGTLCASAGADYTIRLWDLNTGQLLNTLYDHEGWVWAVGFSPDGTRIASGSGGSTVKIWDVKTGQPLTTLHGHSAWVRSVTFSPDGQKLASASADCTVRIWDLQSGQTLHILQGHTSWTWTVRFSPDGATVASSSTDRTVKLWNVETGQLLTTLEGHTNEVWSVRFHPQGDRIASSSADETVRLWDRATGQCSRILRGNRPYEGMNITGVVGLTDAQKATLKTLGAIEDSARLS